MRKVGSAANNTNETQDENKETEAFIDAPATHHPQLKGVWKENIANSRSTAQPPHSTSKIRNPRNFRGANGKKDPSPEKSFQDNDDTPKPNGICYSSKFILSLSKNSEEGREFLDTNELFYSEECLLPALSKEPTEEEKLDILKNGLSPVRFKKGQRSDVLYRKSKTPPLASNNTYWNSKSASKPQGHAPTTFYKLQQPNFTYQDQFAIDDAKEQDCTTDRMNVFGIRENSEEELNTYLLDMIPGRYQDSLQKDDFRNEVGLRELLKASAPDGISRGHIPLDEGQLQNNDLRKYHAHNPPRSGYMQELIQRGANIPSRDSYQISGQPSQRSQRERPLTLNKRDLMSISDISNMVHKEYLASSNSLPDPMLGSVAEYAGVPHDAVSDKSVEPPRNSARELPQQHTQNPVSKNNLRYTYQNSRVNYAPQEHVRGSFGHMPDPGQVDRFMPNPHVHLHPQISFGGTSAGSWNDMGEAPEKKDLRYGVQPQKLCPNENEILDPYNSRHVGQAIGLRTQSWEIPQRQLYAEMDSTKEAQHEVGKLTPELEEYKAKINIENHEPSSIPWVNSESMHQQVRQPRLNTLNKREQGVPDAASKPYWHVSQGVEHRSQMQHAPQLDLHKQVKDKSTPLFFRIEPPASRNPVQDFQRPLYPVQEDQMTSKKEDLNNAYQVGQTKNLNMDNPPEGVKGNLESGLKKAENSVRIVALVKDKKHDYTLSEENLGKQAPPEKSSEIPLKGFWKKPNDTKDTNTHEDINRTNKDTHKEFGNAPKQEADSYLDKISEETSTAFKKITRKKPRSSSKDYKPQSAAPKKPPVPNKPLAPKKDTPEQPVWKKEEILDTPALQETRPNDPVQQGWAKCPDLSSSSPITIDSPALDESYREMVNAINNTNSDYKKLLKAPSFSKKCKTTTIPLSSLLSSKTSLPSGPVYAWKVENNSPREKLTFGPPAPVAPKIEPVLPKETMGEWNLVSKESRNKPNVNKLKAINLTTAIPALKVAEVAARNVHDLDNKKEPKTTKNTKDKTSDSGWIKVSPSNKKNSKHPKVKFSESNKKDPKTK